MAGNFKYYLFFIFIFFVFAANAQMPYFQRSWKDFFLNEKVKSFTTDEYDVEMRNDSIVKKTEAYEKVNAYTFNENGFITQQYQTKGFPGEKSNFIYDSSGTKLIYSDYYTNSNPGYMTYIYNYEYDGGKNPVTIIEKHPSNIPTITDTFLTIFSFKYNSRNEKTEEADYGTDSVIFLKSIYAYDKMGNQIQWDLYDTGNIPLETRKDSYDKKGNLIEENVYDSTGHTAQIILEYDDKGNMTKEIYCYWKTKFKDNWVWKYEYDSIGNWIKKTKFRDGNIEEVTTREIEYY